MVGECEEHLAGIKMEWDLFKQQFLDQYFPLMKRRKMKQELARKAMSIIECETRFIALSRFALDIVSTETLKCAHFE